MCRMKWSYSRKQSKHVMYNTAGSIVSLFCQWLIIMLIPRMTDFSEAGIFAVALSICSIINIFATFSLNQYQISDQHVNYSENEYRVARIITIAFSFALCIPVVLFMGYSPKQNLVIIMYMVYRNLLHFAYLYTAALQIKDHLDYAGKCTIAEGIESLVSFLIVYYLTENLVLSVAVMAVFGGGLFLLSVIAGYKKYVGDSISVHRADPRAVKSLIRLGVPLLLAVVAPIVITALPKLILQIYGGDETVGIFSTLSAPTIIVPTIVTGVFVPFIIHFSDISRAGDMKSLRRDYAKTAGLILGFGALCVAAGAIGAEYAFRWLYGEQIVPYVHYFCMLLAGITLYSVGMCGITVLMTKEQGRAAAILSIIAMIVSVPVFLYAIPAYGMDGAVYSLTAVYSQFGLLISLGVVLIPLYKFRTVKTEV